MKDLNSIINKLSESGVMSGLAGGLAGGTLVGALTSKGGRKLGKTVLQAGALAAVGGLAWKAYQSYSQKRDAAAAQTNHNNAARHNAHPAINKLRDMSRPQFDDFIEAGSSGQLVLLRAMIAAAYADGHIDSAEQQRIFEQVETMELNSAEKATLFDELRNPLPLQGIIKLVPNMETAVEVYALSLLAIDESQPASVGYLRELASRLELPQALVNELHAEVVATKKARISSVA